MSANEARRKFLAEFKKLGNRHAVYRSYMSSNDWSALREAKLLLEPECEICGKEAVDVIHVDYRYLYDCGVEDLESICGRCKTWKFANGLFNAFH